MPNPVVNDVHISAALSQIATAYLQNEANYIADKVFPVVPVQHQADKYFKYSKSDFFRDQAQQRADATESAGGGFTLGTGQYSASVWGFHKDIGDQVRRNADPAVDIDVATTKFVMQTLLIRRERFFCSTYLTNGVWGNDVVGGTSGTPGSISAWVASTGWALGNLVTANSNVYKCTTAGAGSVTAPSGTSTFADGTAVWTYVGPAASATQTYLWSDDANGDPFTDVAAGQTALLQNTGQEANTLTITYPVYQALRKHPLVLDRIKYTNPAFAGTVTPALLASAFDIDRVLVSKAVFNSGIEGGTDAFSFIAGKDALLTHSAPAPGLMVPSAGYTFSWEGFTGLNNLGVRILQIPMPWLGANTVRTEGEMSFDMQVVGSDLGYHFSGIA